MKHKLLTTALLSGLCIGMSAATSQAQIYPATQSNYMIGTQTDGITPVRSGRQTPDRARIPQYSDASTSDAGSNFCSLGFGGSLDLAFAEPFMDGAGVDLILVETSFGNPVCNSHPEKAQVWVSQTGAANSWVLAGEGCQNFTVELPDNMPWAKYVRVKDVSDRTKFGAGHDGYDLDGVVAMHKAMPTLNIPEAIPGCNMYPYAMDYMNYLPGKTKNNKVISNARNKAMKTLGAQGNDVAGPENFASLGFGGEITLMLGYTVIDQAGADLAIFETTWGDNASKSDASYPEMVDVYGSNNGTSWTLLTAVGESASLPAGRICRDGKVDISGMPLLGGVASVRYIKLIDKSVKESSKFPGSADGYDVDAIVAMGCPGTGARLGDDLVNEGVEIGESVADFDYTIAPNPVQTGSNLTLMFQTVQEGTRTLEVLDLTGKSIGQIASRNFEAGMNRVNYTVGSDLKPGVYMIRIIGADAEQAAALRFVVTQ